MLPWESNVHNFEPQEFVFSLNTYIILFEPALRNDVLMRDRSNGVESSDPDDHSDHAGVLGLFLCAVKCVINCIS